MLYSNSITSQVVSDFTTISSSTGCGSLVVEFEDLSTGNPDTWIWDFGNGNTSNIQHPTVIYQDTGLYTVKLIASNINSSDERIQVDFIRVYANPSPSFTQNLTEFCVPLDVTFIDQSFSSSNILSWMWDFGDGETGVLRLSVNGSTIKEIDLTVAYIGSGTSGLGTGSHLDGNGSGFNFFSIILILLSK